MELPKHEEIPPLKEPYISPTIDSQVRGSSSSSGSSDDELHLMGIPFSHQGSPSLSPRSASWLVEGHPKFLNDDAKTILLEDFEEEDTDDDEEDVDEDDMKYGIAPAFHDLDEELREVEALLRNSNIQALPQPDEGARDKLDNVVENPEKPDAVSGGAQSPRTPPPTERQVQLLELPSHLKMIAKEHKRLLLEKQRRDLAIAAEAANAREDSNVPARTQHTIRRGYLDRLGIATAEVEKAVANSSVDMGIQARRAAIASARTRRMPPSMRVSLRDKQSKKGFFKKIAAWMANNEGEIQAENEEAGKKLRVSFQPTADVYFIPHRTDYPHKVRATLWPTRQEFVEMVMRNMDQVEQELKQERAAEANAKKQMAQNPNSSSSTGSANPKPRSSASSIDQHRYSSPFPPPL